MGIIQSGLFLTATISLIVVLRKDKRETDTERRASMQTAIEQSPLMVEMRTDISYIKGVITNIPELQREIGIVGERATSAQNRINDHLREH
jgi:hypothetical protein